MSRIFVMASVWAFVAWGVFGHEMTLQVPRDRTAPDLSALDGWSLLEAHTLAVETFDQAETALEATYTEEAHFVLLPLDLGVFSALRTRNLDLVTLMVSDRGQPWGVFLRKEDEADYLGYFYYFRNEVSRVLDHGSFTTPLPDRAGTEAYLRERYQDSDQFEEFWRNDLFFPPNPFP